MGEIDWSKLSDDELLKAANSSAPVPEVKQKKLLKGSVTSDADKGAEKLVKRIFPSKDENALENVSRGVQLPAAMGALGFGAVPEDLANAGMGAIEQGLQVPQQNRKNVGDLLRQFTGNNQLVTPNEVLRSPAYQQATGGNNPAMGAMGAALPTAGSFLFPLKMGLGGKAMPAVQKVQQAAGPALQMLNRIVPASNNAGQMIRALGANPNLRQILGPAAAGAGFAPVFGAGAQFGANHSLPTPQQAGQQAVGGGLLGGAMGAGVAGLNAFLVRQMAGQLAKQAPAAAAPQLNATLSKFGIGGPEQLSPNAMLNNYRAALAHMDASKMEPERINAGKRKLLGIASKHPSFKEEGGPEALSLLRKEVAQGAVKETTAVAKKVEKTTEKSEARAFSSKQQQERINASRELTKTKQAHTDETLKKREQSSKEMMQERINAKAQDRARAESQKGTHTEESGSHFRDLYDLIGEAKDKGELDYLEKEVNDAGMTKAGTPLILPHQRNTLMSRLFYQRRKLGGEPGETKAGGEGSEPPANKGEPEGQTGAKKRSAGKTPSGALTAHLEPVAKPTDAESFLTGLNRKTLAAEYMSARNRYKVAVSVDALAKVGLLEQKEKVALGRAVGALSEAAVERGVRQTQLGELIKWALENTKDWEPKIGKVTKTIEEDGIALAKSGETQRLMLKAKMVASLEQKYGQQLSHVRNQLWEEGQSRGDLGPADLKIDPNPTMSVTVNGKAASWAEKANGGLEVTDMKKTSSPQKFKPPKDLEELYDRAKRLQGWIDHFAREDKAIRDAEGAHDYLGDGTKPIDILQKAFKNREDIWTQSDDPSKVPAAHVWHVDENSGYVTTVRFERQKLRASFNEATQDLHERYNKAVADMREKNGYLKDVYSADWLNNTVKSFTGLEAIPFLSGFASKGLHKFATAATRNSNLAALTVGTVDNIIKSKVAWGGPEISGALHNMIGQILDGFARDNGEIMSRVSGAEDLTALLNDFKGSKLNYRSYAKTAIQAAFKAGKTTEPELNDALKRARTALFIRKKYKEVADFIKPRLEELSARETDVHALEGQIDSKRMRKYSGDDFLNGRLRDDVYDQAFHKALSTLHESLELQPAGGQDSMSQLIGRVASRKNASIFGNNFSVGFGNFFDAGISTVLEFHKHFFKATADLMFNPEIREFAKKLPVLPQADMEYVALQESLARRPEVSWSSNPFKKGYYKYEDLQSWLGTKADVVFGGKERIVSLADRLYSRAGALASIYKQAESHGMDGHELLHELQSGDSFTPSERAVVWKRVSEDLSRLYNSVAPHLNRDMLASSTLGRFVAAYSGPQRRTLRIYWDWARSDNPADRLKFNLAMVTQIALAGRGVLPKSVQTALVLAGAATGYNALVEGSFENLDAANVFRRTTGVDLSDRMGFDVLNIAGPPLQALQEYGQKAQTIARKNEPDMVAKEAQLAFGETLALFPRVGPFGWDVWKKLMSNMSYAGKGYKTYYIPVGSELKPVTVPGYNMYDALHDWMVPGLPPSAQDEQQRIRMAKAKHDDSTNRQPRNTLPTGETNSAPSILPTAPKDG